MTEINYNVSTKWDSAHIEQTTTFHNGSIVDEISRTVINLQESGIEEALVEMGWTPPEGHRLRK